MDTESETSPADDVKIREEDVKDEPSNQDANDSDSSSSSSSDDGPRNFWVALWSNILFLNGSVFYMWLAVLDLQWAKELQFFADLIDREFSWRDNYLKELYDYDWTDDYVFEVGFHWVSKYQIVYFIAAASFGVEGFLDFFGTPGIRGLFFIFAGMFGLVSAWLQERNADLSTIFNLMSAHLFMFEAIGLVVYRDEYSGRLGFWVRMNDICFVIATGIDVALSYTTLFKVYNLPLSKLDVSSAALWLFCAVFYVWAVFYAKRHGYFDGQEIDMPDEQDDGSPKDEKAGMGDESPEKIEEGNANA